MVLEAEMKIVKKVGVKGPRGPNRQHIYPVMTLEEVSAILGISKQAVQKIETKALLKLRKECDKRGWTFQDMMGVFLDREEFDNPQYAVSMKDVFEGLNEGLGDDELSMSPYSGLTADTLTTEISGSYDSLSGEDEDGYMDDLPGEEW